MLYATNRFHGDGMTTQYEISFVGGYLDRAHVKAYVEGADLVQTPVTLRPGNFLGPYTIGGLAPVPVGSTLVIYRDTPKAPIVDFVNGSRFTESNLDTATRQGSFIAAEGTDAVSPAGMAGVIQQITNFSGAAAASAALAASYVDQVNPNWNDPNVDTLNGGALAGFRNVIINGDMKVRQREAQSVTMPADVSVFTADRWRAAKHGTQTVIFEHVATGLGQGHARDCIQVRSTTTSGDQADDYILMEQRVEGFETIRLRDTTFTLSFLVKATRPGTYTVAFRNASGVRSYLAPYTVTNSNVWQPVTITVPGGIPYWDADKYWSGAGYLSTLWDVTNGLGVQISWLVNGGSMYSYPSVNQWLNDDKVVAQGNTQGLQANGDSFSITEVQLEVGTKRTPFERRHMSVEIALCKRYFEVVSISGGARGGEVNSLFIAHTPYTVQKRGASTITPRAPIQSVGANPPTFSEVAPLGVYGILRSSSTSEFYYFGLVEANSEL